MIVHADARHIPLVDGCVQCVITSPPYFGLRDYGTATWVGGDAACDHRQPLGGEGASSAKQNTSAGTQTIQYRDVCEKCSAQRVDAQIGLEQTPDAYVEAMVGVFREVKRVLRDDGVLWLNLGDSYCSTDKWGGGSNPGKHTRADDGSVPSAAVRTPAWRNGAGRADGRVDARGQRNRNGVAGDAKPKDLLGIPWRVAFALQADGWYLRSDVIWHKPNPMPESVTDRPTKSHEYLFLLTKSSSYYYDAQAIAEPLALSSVSRLAQDIEHQVGTTRANGGAKTNGNFKAVGDTETNSRNKRSVWTIPTMPYSGAHFATFPEALVEPCVLAGSRMTDLVFDPFLGSGTVGAVAARLGRRWVGTDLNPAYHALAKIRTAQLGLFV